MPSRNPRRMFVWLALTSIALLVAIGLWKTRSPQSGQSAFSARPNRVMGTDCLLTTVVQTGDARRAQKALQDAEAALRHVETLMSTYLEASEVSRLNTAPPGEPVSLSPQTLDVLQVAQAMATQTDGAFDVTCRPLVQLWKHAGREGRLPTPEEWAQARASSRWDHIRILENGAVKSSGSARIDLGGVAKGYAIDRAVDAMQAAGCIGGLVNIGGDLRSFDNSPEGTVSNIELRNPFEDNIWTVLSIRNRAVCTSGNYARFVTINGKRYSHIVNPVTGMPADRVPSVTVTAPTAVAADAWATALSVLGASGLSRMPPEDDMDAMVVVGASHDYQIHLTEWFRKRLPPAFLSEQKNRLSPAN